MVKQEPVSVNWQTAFMLFLPSALWAAYRIEKLRKFLLYFLVIGLTVYFVVGSILFQDRIWAEEEDFDVRYFGLLLQIAIMGASIISIRKWSREWNERVSGMANQD